jgi:hypothetical protein
MGPALAKAAYVTTGRIKRFIYNFVEIFFQKSSQSQLRKAKGEQRTAKGEQRTAKSE